MGCGGSNAGAAKGPTPKEPVSVASAPVKDVPVAWAEDGVSAWQQPIPEASASAPGRVEISKCAASPANRDADVSPYSAASSLREAGVASAAPQIPVASQSSAPNASMDCSPKLPSSDRGPQPSAPDNLMLIDLDEDQDLIDLYDADDLEEELLDHEVITEIEGMMLEMETALIKPGKAAPGQKIQLSLEKPRGHITTRDDEVLMAEILDDECLS